MKSNIWCNLINLSEQLECLFDDYMERYQISGAGEFNGWKDTFWGCSKIRKGHINTVDRRDDMKLWLMHVNLVPNINNGLPILGFDVVSGPNKITGAFLDFSPVNTSHPYINHFQRTTEKLQWKKNRELPDWANEIFSKNMIAAGNITDVDEIKQFCDTGLNLVKYYLENLHTTDTSFFDAKPFHNKYCLNQKKNPNLHKSMLSMGISEADKNRYINEVLFEEID